MAVWWVCISVSGCSLRGACPVSLECWCSSSRNQVARSPAEPAISRGSVYPTCPLWTPASCLPQIPNHHSNWKQCFWSYTDNKRRSKEGQNPPQGRHQMQFSGQPGRATSLPTQCCSSRAPSNPSAGDEGGGWVLLPHVSAVLCGQPDLAFGGENNFIRSEQKEWNQAFTQSVSYQRICHHWRYSLNCYT